jgi:hypothetical protein
MDRNKSQDIRHKSQVISRRLSVDRLMGVRLEKGTAFILVVMLVTLLAVIGTMFLLRARVGRLSASAMRQNSELNNAVDTVVAAISQQLIVDTPGVDVDSNGPRQEYYDYPDANNAWLANLEPYKNTVDANYYWRQVSNIFSANPIATVEATIIKDYQSNITTNLPADADGDGVADSRWIMIPDISTGRGEPVFAAIRVIDNGGMLNVNTAYKFAPFGYEVVQSEIDGSSQLQINLMALAGRDTHTAGKKEQRLWTDRCQILPPANYEPNVIWQYGNPGGYTPFDISDELEIRNRFLINNEDIKTRLEELWTWSFNAPTEFNTPVGSGKLDEWFKSSYSSGDPNIDPNYSYRHLATTYNMDRIINPFGERMVNIQNVPENDEGWAQWLYYKMLLPCIKNMEGNPLLYNQLQGELAQIAANIKDYSDTDTEVTTVIDLQNNPHYGYERPDIRISEIVYADRYLDPNNPSAKYDPNNKIPNDPNFHRSYAIEISNDFRKDDKDFNDWRLVISTPSSGFNTILPITSTLFDGRGDRFFVAVFQDPNAPLSDLVYWMDSPADGAKGVDPNVILRWGEIWGRDANGVWSKANTYDVYFGAVEKDVRDANTSNPLGVYIGRQAVNFFDPFDSAPMTNGKTYYWRVAGVNDFDGNPNTKDDKKDVIIDKGELPWSFTTWLAEPNSIIGRIDPTSPAIFGPDSVISLERWVPGKTTNNGYLIVDMISPEENQIPFWLVDPCDASSSLRARSFQRDLSWQGRLRRLWNNDIISNVPLSIPSKENPTLGWWNNFDWQTSIGIQLPPLQAQHYPLNNVGELGFIFKKSAYYEPFSDRILIDDTEYDRTIPTIRRGIKVDLTDASVQKMFNFLTVMDPFFHHIPADANEWRVQGRININTAPWYVLAQLPWVSTHTIKANGTNSYDLAKAIVAYRDKSTVPPSGLNYSTNFTRPGAPGFENIGQLNNVILGKNNADPRLTTIGDFSPSIQYYGRDGVDQRGFPDLTTDRGTKVDGYADDQEERDLIFARISDLVTVRSDVFTAYILVRLGEGGPQKRVMAILDRSDVRNVNGSIVGNVKIRSLYPVPDPR